MTPPLGTPQKFCQKNGKKMSKNDKNFAKNLQKKSCKIRMQKKSRFFGNFLGVKKCYFFAQKSDIKKNVKIVNFLSKFENFLALEKCHFFA